VRTSHRLVDLLDDDLVNALAAARQVPHGPHTLGLLVVAVEDECCLLFSLPSTQAPTHAST
jgi:hypothetical protein